MRRDYSRYSSYHSRPPVLSRTRLGGALLTVVALVVMALLGRWALHEYRMRWTVNRGLELLASAQTPDDVPAKLRAWVRETGVYWEDDVDDFVSRLYSSPDTLASPHARALLQCASGAYYGDRVDDWKRWYENRERIAAGRPPEAPRAERVGIEALGEASVGLTSWFSTILPMNGDIYVPSLGQRIGPDEYDGVVLVDGQTRASRFVFQAPGGADDILGLAAGDDGLFVSCANGAVYFIAPDGELRWSCRVGREIVSVPLAIDLNDDNVFDVVVATRDEIVAVSGNTGRTVWRQSQLAYGVAAPGSNRLVCAALSSGDLFPRGGREVVVVTETGGLYVISSRSNGKLIWSTRIAPPLYGGAITFNGGGDGEMPIIVGDGEGAVWGFRRTDSRFAPCRLWSLPLQRDERIAANLRTLTVESEPSALGAEPVQNVWTIACPTAAEETRSSVCALGRNGLEWRCPLSGDVWAPPAIADINGDHRGEIIVTSIERDDQGYHGYLSILSSYGHCLYRDVLPDVVECPPVVADVNGDGRLELLLADANGALRIYATRGARNIVGPVEWALPGGDSHNTSNGDHAYSWGQWSTSSWRWKPGN